MLTITQNNKSQFLNIMNSMLWFGNSSKSNFIEHEMSGDLFQFVVFNMQFVIVALNLQIDIKIESGLYLTFIFEASL